VRLCLFGGFALSSAAGTPVRISARKTRALLAYLALRPGEKLGREQVSALLWGESDESLARSSLRQCLTALRRELPASVEQALDADTESISLAPGALRVDALELEQALSASDIAALHSGLALYQGEFLAGLGIRSDAFDDWVREQRALFRRKVVDGLARVSAAFTLSGDDAAHEEALRRHVALEPLDERPRRALMELHARRGRTGEALDEYRRLRETLRRELGVTPEAATEALAAEITRKRTHKTESTPADSGSDSPISPAPAPAPRPPEELRDIAVLAIRLGCLSDPRSVLDPETEARLALDLLVRAREAITALGGTCSSSPGGDVLGVFGAQALRGDETRRAANVALAFAAAAAELEPAVAWSTLKLALSCGQVLTSGEVLAGKPVSVALLLLSDARPTEILITDAFARSLAHGLSVEEREGPDGPRLRLLAVRAASEPFAQPFVGREAELGQLESLLNSVVSSNRGRAVSVRGEPGIGKSTLLGAFRRRVVARGLTIHMAQILDFGQAADRRLLATLTLELLGGDHHATDAERARLVRRAVLADRADGDDAAILCELSGAPLGDDARARKLAVDAATHARARVHAFCRLLLRAAARTPLVLAIEDFHWADAAERELVYEIAAVAGRAAVLVVVSSRPELDPFDAEFRSRARGVPTSSLDLAPLSAGEALDLARLYPELPASRVRSCIERAEGLPLFLDQLLRAARAGDAALPGSIRAVVLARLDRLPDDVAELCFAAAVLGQRVEREAVAFLLERNVPELEREFPTDLLRSEGGELVFSHALFREAVYESLLRATRERLHARAAVWFQDRDTLLSAEHLAAASDSRAPDAYFRAARLEAAAYRAERAAMAAERGRALATEPAERYAANCLLGEIRLHAGRIAEALSLFREALDFASDASERSQAHFGVAGALRILGRYDEALDALEQAERGAGASDLVSLARIHGLRGNVHFSLNFDACLASHERARDFARRAGATLEELRAEGGLGDAYFQRGRMRTARVHFEKVVRESRRLGQLGILLSHLPMLAITRAYDGELDRGALDDGLEAVALSARIGSPRAELLARICVANLFLYRAEYELALEHAELSVELAQGLGARRFEAEALGTVGGAELGQGRRDRALSTLRAAALLAEEANVTYCGPFVVGLLALATTDAAERDRALARGRELLVRGAVGSNALEFFASEIEVEVRAERWHEVRAAADALARATLEEPLVWSELLIRRARLLAEAAENPREHVRAELVALDADIRSSGYFALLPALGAFL
jgi:DNA-binding SARP family transcriptional activator/tetratricopeptide (TPR) repeat protein